MINFDPPDIEDLMVEEERIAAEYGQVQQDFRATDYDVATARCDECGSLVDTGHLSPCASEDAFWGYTCFPECPDPLVAEAALALKWIAQGSR